MTVYDACPGGCPQQYRTTLTLSTPLTLDPGRYWVAIYSSYQFFGWEYASSSSLPGSAGKYDTQAWQSMGDNLAFRLLGTQQTCPTSIVVANTNDSGVGSLRQAIVDVCPEGTISFDSTLSGATITLSSVLILDKNLTIDGSELTEELSISGNNQTRVFIVTTGYTVTLDSLVITNGKNDNGGGIYNGGTLTINNCSLLANTGLIGGGIINHGTLSITNSNFSQNNATNGAALTNWGTATLTGSTISDNQAQAGAGIDQSGGILTVVDSTFSGNTTTQRGGGIIVNPETQANVSGSTFVNNTAGEMGGGGIINYGTTSVVNSTFTGNVTASTVKGSAINNTYSTGNLTLYNSTLSGNTGYVTLNNENGASMALANTIIANTTGGWDCSNYLGTISESINNWVSDGDTSGADPCGATLFGDPMLTALADNGGSTQTMALQAGSGTIDAGDDSICAGTLVAGVDQRGVTRPQGVHCDIGAFELESSYLWQQLPGGESQQASYAGNQSVYDDFVLSETATIREVELWSSTADPIAINVGFYVNADDGNGNDIPGAYIYGGGTSSIVTTVEDPAVCSQAYCAYRHSFMTELLLDPGHYWISIYGAYELYWSSAADLTGSFAYYPYEAVSPTLGSGNLAFRLLDYVSPKITSIFIEPTFPGMPTRINVNFTDPDSSSHSGVVDWGDGIIDDANYCGYNYCVFPEHTYTEAGTYTVQVWVTDSEGHTGTLSTQYDVSYLMVPPYLEDWLASDTETTTIEIEGAALEGHYPLNFTIVTNPDQHGTFNTPSSSVCEFEAEWGAAICRASVVYTPPTETYLGYDNFSYTVDDGQGVFHPLPWCPSM